MKHIKTYEDLLVTQEYQIGDYVLLIEDPNRRTWNVDLLCKIIDVTENKTGYRTDSIYYKMKTFYIVDQSEAIVLVDQKEIIPLTIKDDYHLFYPTSAYDTPSNL